MLLDSSILPHSGTPGEHAFALKEDRYTYADVNIAAMAAANVLGRHASSHAPLSTRGTREQTR